MEIVIRRAEQQAAFSSALAKLFALQSMIFAQRSRANAQLGKNGLQILQRYDQVLGRTADRDEAERFLEGTRIDGDSKRLISATSDATVVRDALAVYFTQGSSVAKSQVARLGRDSAVGEQLAEALDCLDDFEASMAKGTDPWSFPALHRRELIENAPVRSRRLLESHDPATLLRVELARAVGGKEESVQNGAAIARSLGVDPDEATLVSSAVAQASERIHERRMGRSTIGF